MDNGQRTTDDDEQRMITIAHSELCSDELIKYLIQHGGFLPFMPSMFGK